MQGRFGCSGTGRIGDRSHHASGTADSFSESLDTSRSARRGRGCLNAYKERDDLESVNVDSAGIGWGMYSHLLDLGFPAVAVNVGERARDSEKYVNAKAEHYWGLRLRAEAGDLSGLGDEKTIAQLTGIRYSHDARGRVAIETKEEARRRGVKSPDRAESVMLAFAECGAHGAIYGRSFSSDELLFDLTVASPGFGNYGSYQQRIIAVGYGTALPMAWLEIIDDGKLVWVLREYFVDPARETELKTDAAYAADVETFAAGRDPLFPNVQPVIRSKPKDARIVMRESPETENFQMELRSRGFWCSPAEEDVLRGIELVGSLFERKAVRVNWTCRNFIREHRAYGWDRQKAAQGIEAPVAPNAQTVGAFRLFALACIHDWRLLDTWAKLAKD
jgi:hypothetical protein